APRPIAGGGSDVVVIGLSAQIKAKDLKDVFSGYGKVVNAKIIALKANPLANRYGFITMSSGDEASKCVQCLNDTVQFGRDRWFVRHAGKPDFEARANLDGLDSTAKKSTEERLWPVAKKKLRCTEARP
uniref:RRM domain-containing protein n=1 Tax=Monopterus albus TaxID=43700 RepID=A0A3Q3J3W5_MONAL